MKIILRIYESSKTDNETQSSEHDNEIINEDGGSGGAVGGSGGSTMSGGAVEGSPIVGVAGGQYNASNEANLSQFRDIKTANKIRMKILHGKKPKDKQSTKKQVNNAIGNK
jgi:hypothetical protein